MKNKQLVLLAEHVIIISMVNGLLACNEVLYIVKQQQFLLPYSPVHSISNCVCVQYCSTSPKFNANWIHPFSS